MLIGCCLSLMKFFALETGIWCLRKEDDRSQLFHHWNLEYHHRETLTWLPSVSLLVLLRQLQLCCLSKVSEGFSKPFFVQKLTKFAANLFTWHDCCRTKTEIYLTFLHFFKLTISELLRPSCSQFSLFSTKREISDTVLSGWTNFTFICSLTGSKFKLLQGRCPMSPFWSAQKHLCKHCIRPTFTEGMKLCASVLFLWSMNELGLITFTDREAYNVAPKSECMDSIFPLLFPCTLFFSSASNPIIRFDVCLHDRPCLLAG